MKFEDIPALQRDQLGVAVHEAAHAVVATLYGGQVVAAETYIGGRRTDPHGLGLGGACEYTNADTGLTVAHRAAILAAGTAAQAVWLYGPEPTIGQLNSLLACNTRDAAELRRLAGAFSAPLPPGHVLPVVMRSWPAIARLAHKIHRGEPVAHEQVCAAMGIPHRGNEHHRAAILSGGSVPRAIKPPARHLAAV